MFGEQGFDVNALLAQAQAMQSQMQRAQEELAARRVRGSSTAPAIAAIRSPYPSLQRKIASRFQRTSPSMPGSRHSLRAVHTVCERQR